MQENNKNSAADGVTVIVCCYNSAHRIIETIRHLAAQIVPANFCWEVLIINNASTDNTVETATKSWRSFENLNAGFRVIDETVPGQMYARKRGVNEAKYNCIIFCDDDNWLCKDYVLLAKQMMDKDERIGAGGGQNIPATDAAAYPEWWEEYKDKYALGIPAKQSGDVSIKGFVLGAGLVTRKSLFQQAFADKYPSLLNGRNGEKLSTGDDFEYCKRLLLWNYTLHYDERMILQHFIPKERLTIAYRDRLMEGIYEAGKVLGEYDDAIKAKRQIGNKNKFRLLLLTPLRILLGKMRLSRRRTDEEKIKLYYLSPFTSAANYNRYIIKKFLNKK